MGFGWFEERREGGVWMGGGGWGLKGEKRKGWGRGGLERDTLRLFRHTLRYRFTLKP